LARFQTHRRLLLLCIIAAILTAFVSLRYSLPFAMKDGNEGQEAVRQSDSVEIEPQQLSRQPSESSPADQQTEELDDSGGYMWERMDLSPEMQQAYEETIGKSQTNSSGQSEEGYRFRGIVKSRENFTRLLEIEMREQGALPPEYPFRNRLAGLKDRIEAQGHAGDSLYESFQALSGSTDAIAGSPSLSMQLEREAPRTFFLQSLFERNEREGVAAFVEERLAVNEHDLPALLVRLDLAVSDAAVDAVFDNLECLVDAVAEFQPKAVESDAIYYYLLLNGSEYAHLTNEGVQERMETRRQRNTLQFPSMRILYVLEREGEW